MMFANKQLGRSMHSSNEISLNRFELYVNKRVQNNAFTESWKNKVKRALLEKKMCLIVMCVV